jgi:hypothetical protein
MGSLSDAERLKIAYFHALGKVMTEATQAVYESKYKSSHNVKASEIWANEINSAVTFADADNEAISNPAVTKHTSVTLTPIPGSNNQAYYYDNGGIFVRPWISPVDIPVPSSNDPSNGYTLRLYDGSGSQIGATNGAWSIDYYAGIIHFGVGQTPVDLGWGAIQATFYEYSGEYVSDILSGTTAAQTLSGLTDTVIQSLNVGEALVWDGNFWVNSAITKALISDFTESDYVHTSGDELIAGQKTFTDDINIVGNFTVSGLTTYVNTQDLNIKDNVITLNSGETGAGVTKLISGILIDRGTEDPYYFIYDESTEAFRIGAASGNTHSDIIAQTLPVATEQYVLDQVSGLTTTLSGLTDTEINNLQSGDTLLFSGGTWINVSLTLDLLQDVFLTTPNTGDTLIYSGDTWINQKLDASLVSYDNNTNYNNVAEVLNELTHQPVFVAIYAPPYDYFQTGSTITLTELKWTSTPADKITSQTLLATGLTNNSYSITSGDTGYTFNESVAGDFMIEVMANDGLGYTDSTYTDSLVVKFTQKYYWGTNSAETLDSSDITGLTNSDWVNDINGIPTRKRTFTADGNGEYIYYCYPASLGTVDQTGYPPFKVSGLMNSAWTLSVQNFTNSDGYAESYNVYRTDTIQNGLGIEIEKL